MTKPLDQMSHLEIYEAVQANYRKAQYVQGVPRWRRFLGVPWRIDAEYRTWWSPYSPHTATLTSIPIYRPRPEWME
jgi:hypothetical protein